MVEEVPGKKVLVVGLGTDLMRELLARGVGDCVETDRSRQLDLPLLMEALHVEGLKPVRSKPEKNKRGSAGCSHKSRRCTGSLRLCFTCDEKKQKKRFVCAEHQCRICKKCPLHCLRRNFDPPHDFEPS